MGNRKRGRSTEPLTEQLDIAIVTAPVLADGVVSLRDEALLVKSALLYADSVELISHSALLLAALQAAVNAGEETLIEFLAYQSDSTLQTLGLDPDLTRTISGLSAEAVRLRRQILGGRKSRSVRRNMSELYKVIDEFAALVPGQSVADLASRASAAELEEAIDLGILRYSPRGEDFTGDFESREDYLPTLKEYLTDPATHVLFDREMSDLVRTLTADGRIAPHEMTVEKTSRAGVGTDLIARLPAFPNAPLKELLAARSDLQGPLQAYRAAVRDLAAGLAYGPFEKEAVAARKQLWVDTVLVRINELKAALAETKLGSRTVKDTVGRTNTIVGAGVAAITMGQANLGPVADIVAAMVGGAVAATTNSLQTRDAVEDEIRKDQMYYLFELDRRV